MRVWGRRVAGWCVVVGMSAWLGCTRSVVPPSNVLPRYEGPIDSRDVVEGGRIYATLCAACHDGRVNPRGYHWTPAQMRHQIREGNRLMPPLDEELLSYEQVEAVLAYLSVMGALEGELPPPTEENQDFAHLENAEEAYEPPPEVREHLREEAEAERRLRERERRRAAEAEAGASAAGERGAASTAPAPEGASGAAEPPSVQSPEGEAPPAGGSAPEGEPATEGEAAEGQPPADGESPAEGERPAERAPDASEAPDRGPVRDPWTHEDGARLDPPAE